MFSEAQNIVITGGTFTTHVDRGEDNHFNAAGNVDASHARAMEILRQHIASGAFHDSAERFDPPKCHPQTRQAIIKKIMDWIEDPENLRHFLWMYGPAGCGKSAIAQTIAEMCAEAGILAGSFFFSRTAADRNKKDHFIPSLAYQLCLSISEMRVHVAMAVEHDPTLFSRSLMSQTHALLVKPLNQSAIEQETQHSSGVRPRLIIVDGLDECNDASSQSEILIALSAAIKQSSIPLLFLVASRAEHEIRQAFNSSLMRPLMTGLPLDDSYEPDADIRIFLKSKFAEIKEKHPSRAYIPTDWPSAYDIDRLVEKSSGQFIYASTVMKDVGSRHTLPMQRLKVVLGISAVENDADMPFAQLDALYHHILSSVYEANLPKALELLSWRILDSQIWTLALADDLFSLQSGGAQMILSDLHALLHIPESEATVERVRILHASFPDFLLDQSRSGRFFIDVAKAHTNLARRWLRYCGNHKSDLLKAGDHIDPEPPAMLRSARINEAIFRHCRHANLSAELQVDLYNFEVDSTLSITGSDKEEMWLHLGVILDFIAWLEYQMFPDPSKDVHHHLLLCMQKHVRASFSQYPKDIQHHLPVAFTLSPFILDRRTFIVISRVILEYLIYSKSVSEQAYIEATDHALFQFHGDQISRGFGYAFSRGSNRMNLLCRLLTNDMLPMAGGYFVDQNVYADLAFEIARFLFPPAGRLGMAHRWFNVSSDRYWASKILAVTLSKASPASRLAEILRDNALRFETSSVPAQDPNSYLYKNILPELALASLVYIKECNIPFREHSHKPADDVCYECLSQEWEDELSVEPIPERIEEVIPAAPWPLLPLFLFAWFGQLLETLMRDIHHMYI